MQASHWLTAAIRELHGLPCKKERRTELRHRLVDIQAHILEEMSTFSQQLDVKEIAERVEEQVDKATFLDKLFIFADLARSPDPVELRNNATKAIADHPLISLLSTSYHDSEGKVIHRTEGGLEAHEKAIESQIALTESLRRNAAVGAIEPARHKISARHLVSEDVLVSLLQHSPFVPPDLLLTFSRGFSRFFQGDFISAVYTLTPLLENSLRYVLKTHGHDVTKFDDAKGTQEDRAIPALVEQMRSEMEGIFTKSIVADIELVFLKKPGPSIRHGVAHGLLQDGSAFGADAIYACWLIFRLCCIPLFSRRDDIRIIEA
jgi:hypothetical protein